MAYEGTYAAPRPVLQGAGHNPVTPAIHWRRLTGGDLRPARTGAANAQCDAMAVSIVDFSTPAAGFDQPLALWAACHDRIRRMVTLLQRLNEHLEKVGVDNDAGITAISIRRYFDEAAPRHHEDEEIDLFPLLRERAKARATPAEANRIAAAIDTLTADHADMRSLWAALREPLIQIEAGRHAKLDEAVLALFAMRYREHAEVEDTLIAPALHRLLTKSDLAAIGHAMAQRRGVDWKTLGAHTPR